jgi:tRNA dimethylallyltransferase
MICIVGPTASGKTELALALARDIGGEIISADSRQVYRELGAGTAKPPKDPQGLVGGVPYHLIDSISLSETFDAGRFVQAARPLIIEILQRGNRPIVAGGTGLYLKALLEGLSEMPQGDCALRLRLKREAAERGREWLHQRLSQVDREAAERIPANNIQRLMRALEVYELTGRPISSFWGKRKKAFPESQSAAIFSIAWPPEQLKNRILQRSRALWPALLREARELLEAGFSGSEPGFMSLGYREAISCARGLLSPDEGLKRLTTSTLAYAKRQRTWLKHQLSAIEIPGENTQAMLHTILRLLRIPSTQDRIPA